MAMEMMGKCGFNPLDLGESDDSDDHPIGKYGSNPVDIGETNENPVGW